MAHHLLGLGIRAGFMATRAAISYNRHTNEAPQHTTVTTEYCIQGNQQVPMSGHNQQGYPQGAYPQPVYVHQQQGVLVVEPPTTPDDSNTSYYEKYNKKAGAFTGMLQIFLGVILCGLGITALVLGTFFRVGWGIWGSLGFYMVAGCLGVASKSRHRGVIIAYMVMCILSAICAAMQALSDAFVMSVCYGTYNSQDYDMCRNGHALTLVHAFSALVASIEMVVAIVASVYCCHGACGCCSTSNDVQLITNHQAVPGGYVNMANVVEAGFNQTQNPITGYPQPAKL